MLAHEVKKEMVILMRNKCNASKVYMKTKDYREKSKETFSK